MSPHFAQPIGWPLTPETGVTMDIFAERRLTMRWQRRVGGRAVVARVAVLGLQASRSAEFLTTLGGTCNAVTAPALMPAVHPAKPPRKTRLLPSRAVHF